MIATIVCDQSSQNKLAPFMNTTIHNQLASIKAISWYDLHKEDAKPCIGCFNCWLKTPGQCVQKDISSHISKDMVNSDSLIYVTPLLYGSYSTAIKRVVDHILPLILPFFKMSHGEVHHVQRYAKRPKMIMIAYNETISDNEKETFISLAKANAVNMDIPKPQIYFCTNETEIMNTTGKIKNYSCDYRFNILT
jgi:multimeric flavodoxin WrbA